MTNEQRGYLEARRIEPELTWGQYLARVFERPARDVPGLVDLLNEPTVLDEP